MADNTTINPGTGGDVIATDDLTTLNGGAVSGIKVQRVKTGWGVDAALFDTTVANPMPVQISDGADVASVVARGSYPQSGDKALLMMEVIADRPVYQLSTPDFTIPTLTAAAVAYPLTIWHPATLTKDIFITEIGVNVRTYQTAGTFNWELSFISAENVTPGGTAVTPQQLSLGDPASGATVRTNPAAPTLTGQIFQRATHPLPAAATPAVGSSISAVIIFQADSGSEYISLRNGVAEGLALRTNVVGALTVAPVFNVYARFIERA